MTNESLLTKKDISLLLETFKSVFITKTEFDEFKKELNDKLKGLPTKDEFYKMMDKVIGELQTIREEQIIIGHQVTDNRERISALEEIHPAGQHKTL